MNAPLYPYSFALQQEKQKAYLLLQRLLLVISGVTLLYTVLNNHAAPFGYILGYIGVGFISIGLVNYFSNSLLKIYLLEKTGGLTLGFCWLLEHQYWMCLLTIGLTILFAIATAVNRIWVGKNILWTTGPFKRNYDWNLLQQVIIKDGVLTIDFKNNRLFQQTVASVSPIQEKDFNQFCEMQLQQHITHA